MKTVKTSTCEVCGTEYPYRAKKRFCSSSCRRKAFEERLLNVSVATETKTLQTEIETLRTERKTLQSIMNDNIDNLPKEVQEVLKLKEEYPVELCGRDIRGLTKPQVMKIIKEFRLRRSAT